MGDDDAGAGRGRGGARGTGFTYADTATARLVHDLLARVVHGRDAMQAPAAWQAMVQAIRNLGRPGIASMAIAAVDAALWDLKARLLGLPLVALLGAVRESVPIYGSGHSTRRGRYGKAMAAARRHGAPILARGGASLAGQCCNVAVVLDMSKYMNRVLSIDPDRRLTWVQPGTILDTLRHAAEQYHLTFGPDPATHDHCTLDGMIGNNSCGVHSMMAGKTDANDEELEILTYDGVRMRVGQTGDDELEQIIREGGRRGEIYGQLRSLCDKAASHMRLVLPCVRSRVRACASARL